MRAPVTKTIIALNLLVFVAMVARGVSFTQPTPEQLLRWGANLGVLTLDADWWRLLTNVFLHIGAVHIAVNMWSLWNVGELAEELYGRSTYLFLYLFTGAAGSVASAAWHPFTSSAGASGAIFGVVGALLVTFKFGKLELPHEVVKPVLSSLTFFTLFNVGFGAVRGGIDNAAHLGGLLSGALLGAVMNYTHQRGKPSLRTRDIVLLGIALAAAFLAVRRVQAYAVHVAHAEEAMEAAKPSEAVAELKQAVASRPNDRRLQAALARAQQAERELGPRLQAVQADPKSADAWSELGRYYLSQSNTAQALDAFQRAAVLQPQSTAVQLDLGVALSRAGRYDEAIGAFQRAIQLDPKLAAAYLNAGGTYLQLRNYEQAQKSFQQAATLQPERPDAYFGLAAAYKGRGMTKEASDAFEQAKKLQQKMQQAAEPATPR